MNRAAIENPNMNEPTIICPSCKTEIKLNESLAAPLIEATRQQYEQNQAPEKPDLDGGRRKQDAIGYC